MYGSKAYSFLVIAIVFSTLLMSGCGGKTPPNGAAPLNITTPNPLPVGAIGDTYREGLAATGGQQPYTWTIDSGALPPGLSLTPDGVISGTPTTVGNYSFTLRVTDSQSPVKAYQVASTSITINLPLSFSSTPLTNAVIAVAYSNAVAASGGVTCGTGSAPAYAYALITDAQCLFTNLPACTAKNGGLTLNADGTIMGTSTGPIGTYPFTVQATDCYPTTATANFSLTVTGKIQGNYAFSFTGYNNGQPFYMAGSFVADGNGNITSGVFDRNGNDATGYVMEHLTPGSGANGQCSASGAPTGTGSVYCVGRPGVTSGGNLGTIVIVSPLGTYSFSVSLSLISDSRIILADPNHPNLWGSGVLKSQGQILSGISLASGNFAFGSYGVDSSGGRYADAGYFVTDANGNIQSGSGEADTNDNGTVQSQAPLTGNVSAVDPATGRGTATFTIGSSTLDYAFYVVPPAPGKLSLYSLVAVQTDAVSPGVPVTLASIIERGPANGGTTLFSNAFLNAAQGSGTNGDVFELNAVSNSAPDISLGLGDFDGATDNNGNGKITSYSFDENKGGALTTPSQNNYTGTYSVVGTTSGRVTVNLTGVANNPVWYLVSSNTGFVVGTDPEVTAGTFEPQAVTQPITITSLFGTFYGGTTDPVLSSVINEVEVALITPPPPPGTGNGTFAATYDTSGTTGVLMNQSFAGAYCLADTTDTCPSPQLAQSMLGRELILDSKGNTVGILYLVSAGAAGATNATTKVVSLSTDANPPRLTALTH